jgi:hypothetical protein
VVGKINVAKLANFSCIDVFCLIAGQVRSAVPVDAAGPPTVMHAMQQHQSAWASICILLPPAVCRRSCCCVDTCVDTTLCLCLTRCCAAVVGLAVVQENSLLEARDFHIPIITPFELQLALLPETPDAAADSGSDEAAGADGTAPRAVVPPPCEWTGE